MNGCEEVASGFVVTRGDSSKKLEFGEKVLDQMPGFIKFLVVPPLLLAIGLRWDYCLFSGSQKWFQHPSIRVEALVGNDGTRLDPRQQHIGPVQFAALAAAQVKADRVAERVDGGMNLGAQPPFAAPDGLAAPFSALRRCVDERARWWSPSSRTRCPHPEQGGRRLASTPRALPSG